MPLTDVEVRNARPRDKAYRLTDGLGMYLEALPAGAGIGGSNIDSLAKKSDWRWVSTRR